MKYACIMMWLFLSSFLWARLGEIEAEANKRYGNDLTLDEPQRLVRPPIERNVLYKKDEYVINTFYKDGKIAWLTVQREPLRRLEAVEINTFLKANLGEAVMGSDGKEVKSAWVPDGRGNYIRNDGLAHARVDNQPYQGVDVPVAVSIFSTSLFTRRGDIRPEYKNRFPAHIKVESLREF
jgi:hypothetical protein